MKRKTGRQDCKEKKNQQQQQQHIVVSYGKKSKSKEITRASPFPLQHSTAYSIL